MSKQDGSHIEARESALFSEVSEMIEWTRQRVSVAVNSELVVLYWHIGKRIREEVLGEERAAYGQDVIKRLAARLTREYGRGYSWRNLFRMVKFAELYPDVEIFSTVSRKLGWSHIAELLLLDDPDEREFYTTHAAHERWSVRTLRERIASGLYARTITGDESTDQTIAAVPESHAPDHTSPSILFRDPYVLDFLGLPSKHTESQLETAILDEIQRFLLELGVGFTERCYVAIELKTRPLDPGDYGQMLLYLRWLDAHQRHPGDSAPVGLILCTDTRVARAGHVQAAAGIGDAWHYQTPL